MTTPDTGGLRDAGSGRRAREPADEELVRAREALRESQERLEAALFASGMGTFRWTFRTNAVEWDENLGRLFGLVDEQSPTPLTTFLAAIHPGDRTHVTDRFQSCADDGCDVDMEFRVVWPGGAVHWIEAKAKTFPDRHGKPLYMTGACADLTRHKEAAEALREREERLRAMFNQAAVGIAIAELDGRFLEVNRKYQDILGYSLEELRGMTFADVTHTDDLGEATDALRQVLSGRVPNCSIEKRYVRKDGAEIWCRTTLSLLRDASGHPQRVIRVTEDISTRKQVDIMLSEETRILELLNQAGGKLTSQLDLQSVIQAATDTATALSTAEFGAFVPGASDHGQSALLRTAPDSARKAFDELGDLGPDRLLLSALAGKTPLRWDDVTTDPASGAPATDAAGRKIRRAIRSYLAVPVTSRSGALLGGLFFGHPRPHIFTERTDRLIMGVAAQAGIAIDNAMLYEAAQQAAAERQALLERERIARNRLERMSAVKDEFLATLSHELRTPLNAILGWAQFLRSGAAGDADRDKGLATIERNARVQTRLIEDLLDMSRITSGRLRLDIKRCDPVAIVDAALESVHHAADAKDLRVERFLDPATGPMWGDPDRLQQVVWNLVSNAIKFTPRGGRVQVLLKRADAQIEITVTDTGAGIRPEFVPHLFERFLQADSSITRQHGGLGLGLSIVKSLVELHGGCITIASPGVGLGTTAIVRLPVAGKAVNPAELAATVAGTAGHRARS